MIKNHDPVYWMTWIVFLIYLLYRVALVFYPQPDAGGVEGNIVYFIQRLLDGQSLYTDPGLAPYAIAQYAPLYYYLVAGLAWIAGVKPDDVLSVFKLSRIVSLLLNLLLIGITYQISRRIFEIPKQRSFPVAALAFIFLEITSFSRPDSLYHVLFLASILIFFRFVKKDGRDGSVKLLFLLALCAVAAIFAKQSAFLIPLIAGAWFIGKKQFRPLFIFAGWYAIMLTAAIGIIYFSGNAILLFKNTVTGINNGISPGWFNSVIMPGFYYGFGLVFVLAAILLVFILRNERTNLLRAAAFTLIIIFILNNALAIKNGSNPGYYTEWWILVFILVGKYWPLIRDRSAVISSKLPAWFLGSALLIKILMLSAPVYSMLIEVPFSKRKAEFEAQRIIAMKLVADNKKGEQYFVFTNFNTAESYFSNLLFRHAIMPQMDIIALSTYPQKKYDYTDFKQRLLSGAFRYMIMKETGPQKQFFGIRLDNYNLVAGSGGYNIYEYNSLPGQ